MPSPDELLWFGLGVCATLAVQVWLRLRRRVLALKSFVRRQAGLMHVAETHGHAWDQHAGGICSRCLRDLTLPGVAAEFCTPSITEEGSRP